MSWVGSCFWTLHVVFAFAVSPHSYLRRLYHVAYMDMTRMGMDPSGGSVSVAWTVRSELWRHSSFVQVTKD